MILFEKGHIHRLITIRKKQAEIWKDQLILEQRILCKFLPEDFDHLEKFISPFSYIPLNSDKKGIEVKNKRHKIVQEAKRVWLNSFFYTYEIQLNEYEQQYRDELVNLKSHLLNSASVNNVSLFNQIKEYMNCRSTRLKKEIYDKMSPLRRITLQNRQRSSSSKTSIGVSPEPYLDLMFNPFDTRQWNHLSLGETFFSNIID